MKIVRIELNTKVRKIEQQLLNETRITYRSLVEGFPIPNKDGIVIRKTKLIP